MIHNTAIVDPKARISTNVKIGPYSIIGPNVEIDENSEIQSHVSILGNTKIGKNNKIYSFSSIGNDPQDLKYNGKIQNLRSEITIKLENMSLLTQVQKEVVD